jgi:cytidyltransferase-like protein
MTNVYIAGSFDDLRSYEMRCLHEASRLGNLHVLLWGDDAVRRLENRAPKFPEAERIYLLDSLRYVKSVTLLDGATRQDELPLPDHIRSGTWVVFAADDTPAKRVFCAARGLEYRVLLDAALTGFPAVDLPESKSPRKKVIVTGCYDWLHSGHVRFFEEVSGLGDLYVSLGSDATIRTLKGEGHPMIRQEERLYMVQAIRYVTRAFIATGSGYLDAAPEIEIIKPDIYAVNEDGDRPEKRAFCSERGIEYVILRRAPKKGLPARQSTTLRGF